MKYYFERQVDKELLEWKKDSFRKPLLIRGARQVGKSSAVKHLSKQFKYFVKVDFEEKPEIKTIFDNNLEPANIISKLTTLYNKPIIPGETLLFFDEIQLCQNAISSLRYFYEDLPELHVIAAGSLLEFTLKEIPTFGVGRIQSLYMYPMSFDEFLNANGESALCLEKSKASPFNPLPEIFHNKLVEYFRFYIMIGGMPEVVSNWVLTKDYNRCKMIQEILNTTYSDDFAKYKKRIESDLLRSCLSSVANQIGEKFTYSKVGPEYRSEKVKKALELLALAGLVTQVVHSSANGFPLGAEAKKQYSKYLFLDSGLLLNLLDIENGFVYLTNDKILLGNSNDLVNKGRLTEMIAGLELIKYQPSTRKHSLFFWINTSKNSDAEVDYIIPHNGQILPIEIKAGVQGGMKSLYQFMNSKNIRIGVRSSLENFSHYTNGENEIDVIPLYALSNLFSQQ